MSNQADAFAGALEEFRAGKPGFVQPSSLVIANARRFVQAARNLEYEPDIAVDDDGTLAVEVRLDPTRELFAEFQPGGELLICVHNEQSGKFYPNNPRTAGGEAKD